MATVAAVLCMPYMQTIAFSNHCIVKLVNFIEPSQSNAILWVWLNPLPHPS